MGPGFMIQASSRAWSPVISKEPGRRRAREMHPGHGVPPQGLCACYCRFQTPAWTGSWVPSSLCSGVPSLREALRLRWRPQLPAAPLLLPPACSALTLCFAVYSCSPAPAGRRSAPRGRFLFPGGRGGDATCGPQASLPWVVLSWGALRGKGKGDREGVNGGEIGSDRCGQTERPREARTELQVWGDPEGPRETEIPTERKRQNARC